MNTRNSKELVGKTGLFTGASDSVILFNNNLMRMRFDSGIDAAYVSALFQTQHIQNQLDAIKRGTTSVFAIYFKDLKNVELRVPPVDLQRQFAAKAEAVRGIAAQQTVALATAQATFDALLHRSFAVS